MTSATNGRRKRRILIVDDHALVRRGLRVLAEQELGWEVCGEADSAAAAWRVLDRVRPDLITVDVALQDANGVDFIKRVRQRFGKLQFLVISIHDEGLYAERAVRAGALGYVMKHEMDERVLEAMQTVMNGRLYVSPKLTERILGWFSAAQLAQPSGESRLSDRELEVYERIGRGQSTREMAKLMHLSVKTVETHRANIKDKLGLTTASELVRRAVAWIESGKAS